MITFHNLNNSQKYTMSCFIKYHIVLRHRIVVSLSTRVMDTLYLDIADLDIILK